MIDSAIAWVTDHLIWLIAGTLALFFLRYYVTFSDQDNAAGIAIRGAQLEVRLAWSRISAVIAFVTSAVVTTLTVTGGTLPLLASGDPTAWAAALTAAVSGYQIFGAGLDESMALYIIVGGALAVFVLRQAVRNRLGGGS